MSDDAQGKGKKRRGKSIEKSFSNVGPIAIPDTDGGPIGSAIPYPATITVSGFKRSEVVDVDVTLHNFSHVFANDIDMLLVAPGGRTALIMSDTGGGGFAGVNLTFDDEAATAFPETDLTTGAFRPTDEENEGPDEFPAPAPEIGSNVALSTFD